jgi:hypothetical protein
MPKTKLPASADATPPALATINVDVELETLEAEIRGLVKQTLENIVRLGEIFTYIRFNLLKYGEWDNWIKERFNGEISRDSANNFINVYKLYKDYEATHGDGFKALDLGSLYKIAPSTVDSEAKELALELATEQQMNRRSTNQVLQTYRKIKMANAGLAPEAVKLLTKVEVAEDPKQLRDMQRLSKTAQVKVATLIADKIAETPKEAIQYLKSSKQIEAQDELVDTVEVDYTSTSRFSYTSFESLAAESVNVAIVEAPLRFDFVDLELRNLSNQLERVLTPGGFAIITVGHKGIMFAGDALGQLSPLHVLCLRRQPGNTRTIIGVNIGCASVLAVLAYKPPYRSPKSVLVDLQTITESDSLVGLDEVHTGLEKGFQHFLDALVEPDDTLLHAVVSKDHFNITQALYEIAESKRCREFIELKVD